MGVTAFILAARELREAARRPSTYLDRLSISLISSLFAGFVVLTVSALGRARDLGFTIFAIFLWVAWLYALLSGPKRTSDAISGERREGTLGLLLLTPMRPYHVIAGKVAATSLTALYGLLAMMPVLGLALLFGGVSWDQLGVACLNLLNTLFLSLCISLAVSSRSQNQSRAAGVSIVCLLLLTGVAPIVGELLSQRWDLVKVKTCLFAISPISSQVAAFQWGWRTKPGEFFASLITQHIIGWICFAYASFHTKPGEAESSTRPRLESKKEKPRFRRPLREGANPLSWLILRRPSAFSPSLMMCLLSVWGLVLMLADGIEWVPFFWITAVALDCALIYYAAAAAADEIVEQKNDGSFALLLTTRVTFNEIVAGRVRAISKRCRFPLFLLFTLLVLGWIAVILHDFEVVQRKHIWLPAAMIFVWFSVSYAFVKALIWTSIAEAFQKKSGILAAWTALRRVIVPPSVTFAIIMVLASLLYNPPSRSVETIWSLVLILIFTLCVGNAILELRRSRRMLAASDFETILLPRNTESWLLNVQLKRFGWRWLPRPLKLAAALALIGVLGVIVLQIRKTYLRSMVKQEIVKLGPLSSPPPIRMIDAEANAAEAMLKALQLFRKLNSSTNRFEFWEVRLARVPGTNELRQEIKAAEHGEAILAAAHRAAAMPQALYLKGRVPEEQHVVPPWELRNVGKVMQAVASHSIRNTNQEKTFEIIFDLLALARGMEAEVSVPIQGTRLVFIQYAAELVGPALTRFEVSPEILKRLEEQFDVELPSKAISEAIRQERRTFLAWQDYSLAEQLQRIRIGPTGVEHYVIGLALGARNFTGANYKDTLKGLSIYSAALDPEKRKDKELSIRLTKDSDLRPGWPFNFSTRNIWPVIDTWRMEQMLQERVRNVRGALKAERYRREHGETWPSGDTLRGLLPDFQSGEIRELHPGRAFGAGALEVQVER